jgi:hypothetical protein
MQEWSKLPCPPVAEEIRYGFCERLCARFDDVAGLPWTDVLREPANIGHHNRSLIAQRQRSNAALSGAPVGLDDQIGCGKVERDLLLRNEAIHNPHPLRQAQLSEALLERIRGHVPLAHDERQRGIGQQCQRFGKQVNAFVRADQPEEEQHRLGFRNSQPLASKRTLWGGTVIEGRMGMHAVGLLPEERLQLVRDGMGEHKEAFQPIQQKARQKARQREAFVGRYIVHDAQQQGLRAPPANNPCNAAQARGKEGQPHVDEQRIGSVRGKLKRCAVPVPRQQRMQPRYDRKSLRRGLLAPLGAPGEEPRRVLVAEGVDERLPSGSDIGCGKRFGVGGNSPATQGVGWSNQHNAGEHACDLKLRR